MTAVIHYTTCPACNASDIQPVLTAKDYTVSQQEFQIWECRQCTLRFTQDIPTQAEIGAYYESVNYISHSNTKEGMVNKLYHRVRERSLENKRKLLAAHLKSSGTPRLLDVGAGIGAFLSHMKQHSWQVEGVEPSDAARKQAVSQFGISLHPSQYLHNPALGNFDSITMWHVLEHVHTLHEYLDRLHQLLKPDATLFIAVPNYTSYDAAAYGRYWAAYDVPRHLYHFSPDAMKGLLNKHRFTLKAVEPMWYDSFYVSMLSEQYKTGNGSLVKGGITGVVSNLKTTFNKKRCSSLIYVIGK
jgi:SAM-dependent methyltransferase